MKKLAIIATIAAAVWSINTAQAQVQVNLGINIGSQPEWGPVGYDHADYYYLPDINSYYSVNNHQYVVYRNNAWVHTTTLPEQYRNYDLYHGYKVVVNDRDPWLRNDVYRKRYASFKGRKDQPIIRDSKDEKYRGHWDNGKHKGWYKQDNRQQGGDDHDNGNGHGNNGRGNGNGHGRGHDD